MSRLAAAGAGVRRASGVLPDQVQPTQVTFVAQRAPEGSPDLRVIAPVDPAPLRSASPTLRLERLEGFAGDQFGLPYGSEQDQDVGRQVGQVVVPGLILPPTARDLPAQDDQLALRWRSPLITHRELV